MKPRIAIPVPHSDTQYAERSLPPYLRALEASGADPVVFGLELTNQEIARLATSCHAALLPGSKADVDPQKYGANVRDPRTAPADSRRDNVDELLLQDAFNMRKPILGICYGLQSLNVWRSGTLVQHVESAVNHQPGREVVRAHTVELDSESRLAKIIGGGFGPAELWVNSSHHQAVATPGDGLRAVAWAEDGVIEAVEGLDTQFVIAVQWHPERVFQQDAPAQSIFAALVRAARSYCEAGESSTAGRQVEA